MYGDEIIKTNLPQNLVFLLKLRFTLVSPIILKNVFYIVIERCLVVIS